MLNVYILYIYSDITSLLDREIYDKQNFATRPTNHLKVGQEFVMRIFLAWICHCKRQ